jgi:hypothetical protein
VGTMNEGTYPGNLSWPWSVARVMLVLTSMGLLAVDSSTIRKYLEVSRKCMSLSGNWSTVNCIWLSKVLKILSICWMKVGFARTKVSST